jgi:hypothetical protein
MLVFNVSDCLRAYVQQLFTIIYSARYSFYSFPISFSLTMASAVSNAWNEQYTGNSHQLLLQNINRMLRNKPYSNSVAILQSSGSGKSRMVREQSNLVFTLPFNLRAHSDNKSLVFFHMYWWHLLTFRNRYGVPSPRHGDPEPT